MNRLFQKLDKIALPFINKDSFFKISNILKRHNILTIPLIKKNLTHIVQLGKDSLEKLDCTEVVYRFSCKSCEMAYIGEAKRALRVRLNDHIKNKQKDSVVTLHKKDDHDFDWDRVTILDKESNYFKRLISEMIHINLENHSLNKKTDVKTLSRIYNSLFNDL